MEKRKPSLIVGGMQTGAVPAENSMKGPQKIKHGAVLWPTDSISGHKSEETPNTNLEECMHPYVHCSVIYNNHSIDTTQVPINRQMVCMHVYIHMCICTCVHVYIYTYMWYTHTYLTQWNEISYHLQLHINLEYYAKTNKPIRERQITI